MLHCKNCGTPLPSGVNTCPQCGTAIPYAFASGQSGPGGQQVTGNGPPSMDAMYPTFSPAPSPPSQPGFGTMGAPSPVDFGQQSYQATSFPNQQSFVQQASPTPPPAFDYGASPYYNQDYNQAPSSFQATPTPPSMLSKREIPKNKLIALITIAIAILFIGIGLTYYTAVALPAQEQFYATATAEAIAKATADVHAQATATVQAQAQATATVRAEATAHVEATATSLQGQYNKSTSGTPTFTSPLSAQDSGNWDVYKTEGNGGCAFSNGALHATISKEKMYVPCFAQATNYSNFALEVQMTIVKGDYGGLIFRADDKARKYYLFRIGSDGLYSLLLSKDGKTSSTLAYDMSPAIKIKPGQPNVLTVLASGKDIHLYINKQYAGSVKDGTYTAGKIGVFAGDTSNATDVEFKNLRVWKT